ncbi:hypothetical protein [Deinococcus sp. RM]|uniref:hypothetical protein n=1 Tax=Deinococcus sp. RM TaxID=2316359 RepID=UPI0011C230F8|nr:hypothetical protein [Deinococcus sp. RM]
MNDSTFCKKYACKLLSSGAYNPARDQSRFQGYKQYKYSLSGQGVLEIVRDAKSVVTSASIKFSGTEAFKWAYNNNGAYTVDFTMAFMGVKPSNSLNNVCLIPVLAENTPPIASGKMATSAKSIMTCLAGVKTDQPFPPENAVMITITLK